MITETLKDQQAGTDRALAVAQGRHLKMGTDIPNLPKLADPRGIEFCSWNNLNVIIMITFEVPPPFDP